MTFGPPEAGSKDQKAGAMYFKEFGGLLLAAGSPIFLFTEDTFGGGVTEGQKRPEGKGVAIRSTT